MMVTFVAQKMMDQSFDLISVSIHKLFIGKSNIVRENGRFSALKAVPLKASARLGSRVVEITTFSLLYPNIVNEYWKLNGINILSSIVLFRLVREIL
jgi:hypothetical protein